MPFKSEAQRHACWAKYNADKKVGRVPKWDCKEWESAKMLSGNTFELKKQLETYTDGEIAFLKDYYNINLTNKNDVLWLIALFAYHRNTL